MKAVIGCFAGAGLCALCMALLLHGASESPNSNDAMVSIGFPLFLFGFACLWTGIYGLALLILTQIGRGAQ